MKRYYFFTDSTLLEEQTPDQAFGPAGTVNGFDQYRTTNLHSVSESKDIPAFAVCDGLICVQPDDKRTFSIVSSLSYMPLLTIRDRKLRLNIAKIQNIER